MRRHRSFYHKQFQQSPQRLTPNRRSGELLRHRLDNLLQNRQNKSANRGALRKKPQVHTHSNAVQAAQRLRLAVDCRAVTPLRGTALSPSSPPRLNRSDWFKVRSSSRASRAGRPPSNMRSTPHKSSVVAQAVLPIVIQPPWLFISSDNLSVRNVSKRSDCHYSNK